MPNDQNITRSWIIPCLRCEKPFKAVKYFVDRGRNRFCSPNCRYRYSVEHPELRFWPKVNKAGADECWLWNGYIDCQTGYGIFRYETSTGHGGAHRFSWLLHNGEIPNDLHVLHKCDVRACVNPKHLFLGTNYDNIMDMVRKGRNRNGRKCAR